MTPFERTTCDCAECRACCHRQPGPLAPGDFERIAAYLGEPETFAKVHFWASPGAIVRARTGETVRVGTITPKMKDGHCVFLDSKDRCTIHPVAPAGCALFSACDSMTVEEARPRSVWLICQQLSPEYQALRDELDPATFYVPAAYEEATMRLLSVDFDFYFPIDPIRMDWSHGETGVVASMADVIWMSRASGYLMRGEPLPMTDGNEDRLWERIILTDDAKIHVADSHFQIGGQDGGLLAKATSIVSLDAHHDAGYARDVRTWDCSNWALRAKVVHDVTTEIIYPRWRKAVPEQAPVGRARGLKRRLDTGKALGEFDAVFLCRSGAWIPPWLDSNFFQLLEAAPRPIVKLPTFPERRPFDIEEARALAGQWRKVMDVRI